VETPLEGKMPAQYENASKMWNQLFLEFMYAEEQVRRSSKTGRGREREKLCRYVGVWRGFPGTARGRDCVGV
jgi:hypothetical protein